MMIHKPTGEVWLLIEIAIDTNTVAIVVAWVLTSWEDALLLDSCWEELLAEIDSHDKVSLFHSYPEEQFLIITSHNEVSLFNS